MFKSLVIFYLVFISLSFSQYDYNLEDINPCSEYFGQNVGTTFFPDQVTLHYFGHYN